MPPSTSQSPPAQQRRPLVLLFDIGGVCVTSPMRAIAAYERSHSIPPGWINTAISAASPNGSWQRLERGEIPLDSAFFSAFSADLSHEQRWRTFYAAHLAKTRGESKAQGAEESAFQAPPPPNVDGKELYWSMMSAARELDGDMWPALKKLRAAADKEPGRFVIAAMSNTSIFPTGHPFNDPNTPEGKANRELRGVFDVFVSSAHVGLRKPDVGIYYYTMGRVSEFAKSKGWVGEEGVGVGEVVFSDDIGGNLRTGKQLGWRTVKVGIGRVGEAVRELEEVTGLVLRENGGKGAKL